MVVQCTNILVFGVFAICICPSKLGTNTRGMHCITITACPPFHLHRRHLWPCLGLSIYPSVDPRRFFNLQLNDSGPPPKGSVGRSGPRPSCAWVVCWELMRYVRFPTENMGGPPSWLRAFTLMELDCGKTSPPPGLFSSLALSCLSFLLVLFFFFQFCGSCICMYTWL